jgi:hypothetical protein
MRAKDKPEKGLRSVQLSSVKINGIHSLQEYLSRMFLTS